MLYAGRDYGIIEKLALKEPTDRTLAYAADGIGVVMWNR